MPFDPATARPVSGGGFDISTAQPVTRAQAFQNDPVSLIPGASEALPPRRETSIGEDIVGAGETALTLATGGTGGTVGFIGGALKGLAGEIQSGEFGTQESADRVEQSALSSAQDLTYSPRTEAGKRQVSAIGEVGQQLAPLAGLTPQLSTIAAGAKAAVPTLAGKSQTALAPIKDTTAAIFTVQSPTKRRVARLLQQGSTDVDTARFKLDSPGQTPPSSPTKLQKYLDFGGPKVKKDVFALDAIKQGFDDAIIAAVKGSSAADKAKMLKMVSLMERSKENARVLARPSDVAGDTLLQRVKSIRLANRKAGTDIDRVARSLKGQQVNISEAALSFSNALDELGVKLKPNGKGGFVPDFEASQLGPGDRGPLREVIRQMNIRGEGGVDALDVHQMKRIIDNNVTFGKVKTGMSGDAERALKDFRRGLDTTLDSSFPEYNKVNTVYAETIDALNAIQDVAGKKMNLSGGNADKALGTLLRRTISNQQSRVRLIDSIEQIEAVANKYGGSNKLRIHGPGLGNDDLLMQVLFVDELDSVFGTNARTSFQGQISQGIKHGAKAVSSKGGAADVAVDAVSKVAEKVRGINKENAFKAIKRLLAE